MKNLKTIYLLFIISLVIWVCFNWFNLSLNNINTIDINETDYSADGEKDDTETETETLFVDNNGIDMSETDYNMENEILDTKFSVDDLYGSWLLEEVVLWNNIDALKDDRPIEYEDRYIGLIFEYQKNYFKINDEIFENPKYELDKSKYHELNLSSSGSVFQNEYKFIYEYNVNVNKLTLFHITFSGNRPGLGYRVFMIDKDRILLKGFSLYIIAKKVNPAELNPEDIPKPPGRQNPEYIYGKWKIIDKYVVDSRDSEYVKPETITNVGNEYIGQIFEYQKDYCVFNGVTHKNPIYAYDVMLGGSMSEMMSFRSNFEPVILKYHLDGKGILFKYIQQNLIFENEKVEDMGCEPCYINEDNIVFMLWFVEDKYNIFLVAERMK